MTLKTFSQTEIRKHGVPQGSMLGPLMFHNIHKSPSPTDIYTWSEHVIFAGNTWTIISSKYIDNSSHCDIWFHLIYGLLPISWPLSLNKTNKIKCTMNNSPQHACSIGNN